MTPLVKLAAVALMAVSGLQSYHPPSTFETYGDGIDHPLTKRGVVDADSAGVSKAFLESKLGISADAISHRSGSSSDVAQHEYFRQQFNGIPFANAVANVAVKSNKVASYGAGFVKPTKLETRVGRLPTPKVTKEEAIVDAEVATDTKYSNWPIALEYFAKDSDHLVLAHVTQVESEDTGERYESYVDASNGDIVNMISFVHQASYRVVPFTSQDPDDCFAVVTNPQDTVASPDSWHQYGSTTTTTTSGNNAITYKDSTSATTLQSSASNNYNYVFSPSVALATSPNVNTARVNSFYVANTIHNLTYRYDFDEAPYSFQQNNNGKGVLVQDTAYTNNADFSTPPDGHPGRMRMRNGAFEKDVVTHGYGHGISMRLTGGGTARCLTTQQAWGLSEGWGEYVTNTPGGIRLYPYFTSKTTNPLTYASLATLGNEEHAVGEVWALIWHEIYAGLINKVGFSTNKNNPTGTAGNIVALHLFIDSLKIKPCKHTFITARDAIIQADANRYGGANKCATETRRDSTTLPSGCCIIGYNSGRRVNVGCARQEIMRFLFALPFLGSVPRIEIL
ncbi:putative extracellular elastinolytic metallo proteinase precursor [Rhizoctonia solani]|nr:putative extracellular elastinolytic metallo proteinase precursor [Rhizoctonia solani]